MHPIFFSIGSLEIRYYGLMYAISFILALYVAKRELVRLGLKGLFDAYSDILMYSFVFSILGARMYYVVFNLSYYLSKPLDMFALWKGGLAIHGGIIAGVISLVVFSKRKKMNTWLVFDLAALGALIGQTLGRFGNFMNGDAHGLPTNLPWGIVFPEGSIAGNEFPGIPVHPVMLYEMFLNAVFFLIMYFLFRKNYKNGFVGSMYLIFYSIGRFFVSFFRADSLMIGHFRAAHLVSIFCVFVGLVLIYTRKLYLRK